MAKPKIRHPEARAIISEMWRRGYTSVEIARRFGVSSKTVGTLLKDMGEKPLFTSPADLQVLGLARQNRTTADIASALGLEKTVVNRILKRARLAGELE